MLDDTGMLEILEAFEGLGPQIETCAQYLIERRASVPRVTEDGDLEFGYTIAHNECQCHIQFAEDGTFILVVRLGKELEGAYAWRFRTAEDARVNAVGYAYFDDHHVTWNVVSNREACRAMSEEAVLDYLFDCAEREVPRIEAMCIAAQSGWSIDEILFIADRTVSSIGHA